MRRLLAFSVCLCIGTASASPRTRGLDSWSGIASHPAVVNPVVPAADPAAVISLRGEWDFASCARGLHHQLEGKTEAYQTGGGGIWLKPDLVRKINVPGCWEAQGVGTAGMSRCWANNDASPKMLRHVSSCEGWYRKAVTIPAGWAGRRIWIKTGDIASCGWLWVNGHRVAHVRFYCGSAKYEITPFVRPGETAMVVVEADNCGFSRAGGLYSLNHWGGIMRDIELEATPMECFIDDAWVRGDFDRQEAEAHVEITGGVKVRGEGEQRTDSFSLKVTVENETKESTIHSSPSPSTFTLEVPLRDFRPWSPESPNLYTAKVELVSADGSVLQTRHERFGVRKLEVRGREFYLNGKPFFVRGVGWHVVYPLEGAAPADRETYAKCVRKIRAAGFNVCRFHTSCRPPELFEVCDELGMMLEPELPYYTDLPTDGQPFDPFGDAEELYLNYRRHPSFAFYSGGNEGWFGAEQGRRLFEEIRRRDPDRLMIGQDNCYNGQTNKRGQSDFEGAPMNVWPRGSVDPDVPIVCHEYLNLCVKADSRLAPKFTGVWLPPVSRQERKDWLSRFGLTLEQGDRLQDAQAALQRIWRKYGLESARLDPCCDGYSHWSLQDVNTPTAGTFTGQGIFDPFFGDKPCGDTAVTVRIYNGPSALLFDVSPKTYDASAEARRKPFQMFLTDYATNRVRAAGERIDAHFFLAHYGASPYVRPRLKWRLEATDGRVLASDERDLSDQALGGVRPLHATDVVVPDMDRACKAFLKAELLVSGSVVVSNSWDWYLFPRRTKTDGRGVYVAETFRERLRGRFTTWCNSAAEASVVLAPTGDPIAAQARSRGIRLVTVDGLEGPPCVTLGWWRMGPLVGAAVERHPVLEGLPHDDFVTPLFFRILKRGVELTPDRSAVQILYGEGGKVCNSYLSERRHDSGTVEYAVHGLDVLADCPESDALLRALLARGK